MNRINARWLALLAFTLICIYLCWLIILPFINVILWASVLAIVAYPVYASWRARGRGPAVSALLTTLVVVLTVIVPMALVIVMLIGQIEPAVAAVKKGFDYLANENSAVYHKLSQYVDLNQLRDPQVLAERAKAFASVIASRTVGIVGGIAGLIVQVFFVLFTLYYLLKDADTIVPAVREAMPLERSAADAVFKRTHEVIFASVRGVMVISAIQGFLGGIGFWILGIPSAVLWGVMMFLLSMIPMAGAFLVWGPAALYLIATGHWTKALILVIWGGGVIGMVDNLLRPRLVGERTRLHELVVFFSVLGGLQVFGVLGLFVGPVVVAITISLVDVYKKINSQTDATELVNLAPQAVQIHQIHANIDAQSNKTD